MSYIYALVINGEVRYVGQTKNPSRRSADHTRLSYNKDNTPRQNLLRKCINENIPVEFVILEETEKGNDREVWWIKFYQESGARLTNSNNGGGFVEKRYTRSTAPWGERTPIQRRMMHIAFVIRSMRREGLNTDYLEERVRIVREVIHRVGKDEINMRLWDKYGE